MGVANYSEVGVAMVPEAPLEKLEPMFMISFLCDLDKTLLEAHGCQSSNRV